MAIIIIIIIIILIMTGAAGDGHLDHGLLPPHPPLLRRKPHPVSGTISTLTS
jgi:hypothetical protein